MVPFSCSSILHASVSAIISALWADIIPCSIFIPLSSSSCLSIHSAIPYPISLTPFSFFPHDTSTNRVLVPSIRSHFKSGLIFMSFMPSSSQQCGSPSSQNNSLLASFLVLIILTVRLCFSNNSNYLILRPALRLNLACPIIPITSCVDLISTLPPRVSLLTLW